MTKRTSETREIVLGSETVSYTIRQSARARYLRMTIGAAEGLVVTVPRFGGAHIIESFLRQKAAWILKHIHRMKRHEGRILLKLSKEEYTKNKHAFLRTITERVEFFNTLYRLEYQKISVRNQTSLWGSCTRAGNLQFNFKLSLLPQRTIDYVVVHELCHLKEHNHSARFWKLVAQTIPEYKTIRKSLHGYIMQEG